jgi:hypothetical protein
MDTYSEESHSDALFSTSILSAQMMMMMPGFKSNKIKYCTQTLKGENENWTLFQFFKIKFWESRLGIHSASGFPFMRIHIWYIAYSTYFSYCDFLKFGVLNGFHPQTIPEK